MNANGMTVWLGPAAEDMTDDQLERFARVWDDVGKRYPNEDGQDRRDAALSAAVQYLLGETTIDEVGERRVATRAAALTASAASLEAAALAVEDGVPVAQAARRAGIDRMWLLQRLGKR